MILRHRPARIQDTVAVTDLVSSPICTGASLGHAECLVVGLGSHRGPPTSLTLVSVALFSPRPRPLLRSHVSTNNTTTLGGEINFLLEIARYICTSGADKLG